jgi:hypothetical protein
VLGAVDPLPDDSHDAFGAFGHAVAGAFAVCAVFGKEGFGELGVLASGFGAAVEVHCSGWG